MATTDIGLNPPKAGNLHSRTGRMQDALAKFGSPVVKSGTTSHCDMATTASAGAAGVCGVVTSQGDPNNSGLHPVDADVSVRDLGEVEILVLGSTSYARGDRLITSTTAGVAKKLASETGLMSIIAEVLQPVTTGSNPQRISARLVLRETTIA
jgi:hypothetical protein